MKKTSFRATGLLCIFISSALICCLRDRGKEPSRGRESVLVLVYHSIKERADSEFVVELLSFRQQVEYLANEGYQTISLSEFAEWLTNDGSLPANPILLTFDDGNESDYEMAFPILKEHGFTGNLFIPAVILDLTEKKNIKGNILSLIENGFSVGSHGFLHKPTIGLPDSELENEISGSKRKIEGVFRTKVDFFAYPFGFFDDRVKKSLSMADYAGAFTTIPGRNYKDTRPFELRRIIITRYVNMESFKKLVEGNNQLYSKLLQNDIPQYLGKGLFKPAEIELDELKRIGQSFESDELAGQIHNFIINTYNQMGVLCLHQDSADKAQVYFDEAQKLKASLKNK